MVKKALFLEHTVIPATRSIAEITAMLAEAGATAVNQQYAAGRVVGLAFAIQAKDGVRVFQMPVRTMAVQARLQDELGPRSRKTEQEIAKQAERIAWRQLAVWAKAQLAIIELGMVETEEVFLPYLLGDGGRTMWEDFSQIRQIGPGAKASDKVPG